MSSKKIGKITSKEINSQQHIGLCGECASCTPKMDFHLLSLKGEPTLGICPKEEHSVLLSQQGCENWKKRI